MAVIIWCGCLWSLLAMQPMLRMHMCLGTIPDQASFLKGLLEVFKNSFLNLINRYQKQFYKQTTYLRNLVTSITLRHKTQNGYTFRSGV